jgi:hypothetical protein
VSFISRGFHGACHHYWMPSIKASAERRIARPCRRVGRSAMSTWWNVVTRAAVALEIKAYEFDWRIWEASRGRALPYPVAPA